MRLYEATGVGAMLLTDQKDNLGELFEVGREVVAYNSREEAVELVQYYVAHQDEAGEIARAGQARTLAEHTYAQRMQELLPVLQKYIRNPVPC
jgi:spore maturation protein CgeB